MIDFKALEKFTFVNKKSNISLLVSESGHLDTREYELKVNEMNLKLNYGEEFFKKHEIISRRLNTPYDKGIVLLHGDPGTGKTTYIKYLTKIVKNKEIIFIPPSVAHSLGDPSIVPFLMEKRNSILIIEDGERVIADRENNGSSAAVSNILNITDGILGDCLNIQIVATFNTEREKIDKALLRKGRLITEHKFEKLNVLESNTLLKHLNKDFVTEEPMVLTDIYNIDVDDMSSFKNKQLKKVGFV